MNTGGETRQAAHSGCVLNMIVILARIAVIVFLLRISSVRESLIKTFHDLVSTQPGITSVPDIDS